MELKELVWSENGYVLTKSELFDESDEAFKEVFFKKLDESTYGIEKRIVWFHKYEDERFFDTEEEALEDCNDHSEIEVENEVLGRRLKELDDEAKKEKP